MPTLKLIEPDDKWWNMVGNITKNKTTIELIYRFSEG